LLAAQREPQEKKLRFYGNLVANIAFDPTVSREQANLMIKIADQLSYRQLCLLTLFAETETYSAQLRDNSYREGGISDDNENQIAVLYDTYDLHMRGLISHGVAVLGVTDVHPAQTQTQGMGWILYELMELQDIDDADLEPIVRLLQ